MFKKVLLLGIVVSLMAGLALAVQPSRPTQAQDKVEITFVHIFGSDENDIRGQVVQALVNEFMAQRQDIVVNLQSTTPDYTEVFNAALLAAEQGNAPHIVQVDEGATQLAVDSTYFLKITDIATDEQLASLDDFFPQILNFYTVNGEVWSIPWNSSNPLLYYNKKLFEAAGLDPNDPPGTFEEVMQACEQIMAADLNLAGCINWPLTAWFVEEWLAMQNALIINNDNGRSGRATEALLDSLELLAILEWWKELADKGYYRYTGKTADYNGEAGAFITQRFAMHLNSTAGLSNFIYYSGILGYELGVAPLIKPNADANTGLATGGASLWITGGHSQAEIDAARDFVFFMTSTENIARWHKETGYIPNRQSSLALLEAEGWFEANPYFRIAIDQLLTTTPTPATAGYALGTAAQLRQFLDEAFQSVIDGGEDPAEALAAAKQRSDQAIEEYNSLIEG